MNESIKLQMSTSIKKQRSIGTSIELFSQDIDNYSFDITFADLELQAGDQVEVLAKLHGGKTDYKSSAHLVEVDGELVARYVFDTKLIDSEGHVFCYVYLKRDDKSADVGAFYFEVDLSELDKVGGKIAEVYDGRYEDLVAGFEIRLQEYRDSLPQADSVRAEIDVIMNNFGVDSQQVIGDLGEVSATVEIAEAGRVEKESERVQAETERKEAETLREEAEILREESYEQKVDLAIVEADVVDKVDNKVTELTPQINNLTSQLAQKVTILERTEYIKVPTDYPTLQGAIEYANKLRSTPDKWIIITIESGHRITEGIRIRNGDFSFIEITSEDAIVEVEDGFTGDVIDVSEGTTPVLNCLINMRGLGQQGIRMSMTSHCTVKHGGNGVINAGTNGVFVNRLSTLYAHEANFSGANNYGMFVDHANYVYARYVNLSNCGSSALRATKGSIVEIANGDCSNSGSHAVVAEDGSKIIGITDPSAPNQHLDVSNANGIGIYLLNGSEFYGDKVIMEGCTTSGITLRGNSRATMSGTSINNCLNAIDLGGGSSLFAPNTTITDTRTTAIRCYEGSKLVARGLKCNVGYTAIAAYDNADIDVNGADLTNCSTGIEARRGGLINAHDVDTSGHTKTHGFYVDFGAIINANGALGSISVTPNTFSSKGIIFQ